jgi:hypothetical protein
MGAAITTDTRREKRNRRSILMDRFGQNEFQFLDSFQCNPHAIRKIANQFIITMIMNVFNRPNTSRKKHAATNNTRIMGNIGGAPIT